jgi:hypothetical protein
MRSAGTHAGVEVPGEQPHPHLHFDGITTSKSNVMVEGSQMIAVLPKLDTYQRCWVSLRPCGCALTASSNKFVQ